METKLASLEQRPRQNDKHHLSVSLTHRSLTHRHDDKRLFELKSLVTKRDIHHHHHHHTSSSSSSHKLVMTLLNQSPVNMSCITRLALRRRTVYQHAWCLRQKSASGLTDCDLDLWRPNLKIQSVHLCSELHRCCKFGENPARNEKTRHKFHPWPLSSHPHAFL